LKSEGIKRYYANGKLLISGEYLVLSGAEALAVPLKMGQWLEVGMISGEERPCLKWRALVLDKEWFSASILLPDMEIVQSSDPPIVKRLVKILSKITEMNKGLFEPGKSYSFSTVSTFDHDWGMGSSSALIANLARWAMIDPFDLFHRLNKGSGYDVATALAKGPILFSTASNKAKIIPVRFLPAFHQQIWFVYTGLKQDTERSLDEFSTLPKPTRQQIEMINYFTGELLHTKHLKQFMQIMSEHESFISNLLGKITVKEEYFSDFNGEIKSLGAWGGDMMMAVSELPGDYIRTFFKTKNIQTVFDFHSLILS
jgi:mevalonate kinase